MRLIPSREEFLAQWEPRIGPAAARTSYRNQSYRLAAPLAGLTCVAFGFLAIVAGPVAVLVACLCWLILLYATARSIQLTRAANRQAMDHLDLRLGRHRQVPMRSVEVFDRWIATKVGDAAG